MQGISLVQVSHFLFQMPEIKPYMDYFPFPFYIILRDINSLPHVLCDALRQWFELVTAVDMWCNINVMLCGASSSWHLFELVTPSDTRRNIFILLHAICITGNLPATNNTIRQCVVWCSIAVGWAHNNSEHVMLHENVNN